MLLHKQRVCKVVGCNNTEVLHYTQGKCRECFNRGKREYYHKNKKRIQEQQRIRYAKMREDFYK